MGLRQRSDVYKNFSRHELRDEFIGIRLYQTQLSRWQKEAVQVNSVRSHPVFDRKKELGQQPAAGGNAARKKDCAEKNCLSGGINSNRLDRSRRQPSP